MGSKNKRLGVVIIISEVFRGKWQRIDVPGPKKGTVA